MNHLRRTATVIAGLFLSVLAIVAATPAAFAIPLPDPGRQTAYVSGLGGSGSPAASRVVVSSSGMPGWEITLIAVAAAVVATLVTAFIARTRTGSRLHPAAG